MSPEIIRRGARKRTAGGQLPVAEEPDGAGADELLFSEIGSRIRQSVLAGSSDRGHGARTHQSVAALDRIHRQGANVIKLFTVVSYKCS
jgi:hypothetical protein